MKRLNRWLGVLSLEFLGAAVFVSLWQPTSLSVTASSHRQTVSSVHYLPERSQTLAPRVFPYGLQPQTTQWSQYEAGVGR